MFITKERDTWTKRHALPSRMDESVNSEMIKAQWLVWFVRKKYVASFLLLGPRRDELNSNMRADGFDGKDQCFETLLSGISIGGVS
jgi:hypothetical protein